MNVIEPTQDGWYNHDLVRDVLQLVNQCIKNGHFGPYILCVSPFWELYLNRRYQFTPPTSEGACEAPYTLKQRLEQMESISRVVVDYLMSGWSVRLLMDVTPPEDE